MIRPLLSILFLSLFAFGLGKEPWLPSLRLLRDTVWDFSLWPASWSSKMMALFLFSAVVLGLLGWAEWFRRAFVPVKKSALPFAIFFGLSTCFLGLWTWALAVNEILYGPLLALILLSAAWTGWGEFRKWDLPIGKMSGLEKIALFAVFCLWAGEFLSPPLVWDAILDHFRYARETARLHQVLFHWTNHTGDMPKAAEMVLAGFWAIGGEGLSKLALALPLFTVLGLCGYWFGEEKMKFKQTFWVLISCPFLLAIFGWGYVEGFLACFEVLALFVTWRILRSRKTELYLLAGFSLGFCFSIKATALLAGLGLFAVWFRGAGWKSLSPRATTLFLVGFLVPAVPWYLKNFLAFGNPFYPLGIHWFGGGPGYSGEMERALLADTGLPQHWGWRTPLKTLWDCFFTAHNGINAVWTPLFVAALPWAWTVLRTRLGVYLSLFATVFLAVWSCVDQSLRHSSGAALALLLVTGLTWEGILARKEGWGKPLFVLGVVLSLWLTLGTQLNGTAPYASALGLEDPLMRLKRHFSFDTDVYNAYRGIESHSGPKDKVLAFAVFQTYPLERTTFVDFKWKRPIFLEWAKESRTADRLAERMKEEGVVYFLYQPREAAAMSRMEKDFDLSGMSVGEYRRFWKEFMEPIGIYSNCFVYRPKIGRGLGIATAPIPGEAEGILGKH